MGAIISFVLGYILGTRSGEEGWKELVDSWRTISSSQEVRDLAIGGLSVARDALRHGAATLADSLGADQGGSELKPS